MTRKAYDPRKGNSHDGIPISTPWFLILIFLVLNFLDQSILLIYFSVPPARGRADGI